MFDDIRHALVAENIPMKPTKGVRLLVMYVTSSTGANMRTKYSMNVIANEVLKRRANKR